MNINKEKIELELLLQAIYKCYGYDFRNYAKASLLRRIKHRVNQENLETISELINKTIHDQATFERLLTDLSITVTDFFRDPHVYAYIRKEVIPFLKTYPFIKIWHAGCATGKEVYSMAILLHEEGLLDKTTLYATDINNQSLYIAKQGIYSKDTIERDEESYIKSGGKNKLRDYFTMSNEHIKVTETFRKKIAFANHNLVSDSCFGVMNLVVCRNVLIYFNKDLQNRVLKLFSESLYHKGFLCLGSKESIGYTGVSELFEPVCNKSKIYRYIESK